jgi:hypothetical protein
MCGGYRWGSDVAGRDRLLSGCACECVSLSVSPCVCVCVRERERERERGGFDSIICWVRGMWEKFGIGCMGLPPTACGELVNEVFLSLLLFVIDFHCFRKYIYIYILKKYYIYFYFHTLEYIFLR